MALRLLQSSILLFSSTAITAEAVVPAEAAPAELRFEIRSYVVEGATLLTTAEFDTAVAPFIGKDKGFSDVQRAMEAVEEAYAKHGYTAVRVLLPEQELDKGRVRIRVVESRIGKVKVRGNQHVSEANVLNALPSLRSGGVPRSRQIARELKLANENPARQLNVVLKAGEKDEEVDAEVLVADRKPGSVRLSFDNTGTQETGRTRLGLAYSHANLFDADHMGSLQMQVSPQHINSVRVFGAGYKIPRYESAGSLEFFGGYSNVNSLVGGLSNFQGGGMLFSARNNRQLERIAGYDPRLSLGLDWRDYRSIEQTQPQVAVLFREIVVTPLNVDYSAQGKSARSETNFNLGLSANVPMSGKGKKADFANYDPLGNLRPDADYRIVRYGASHVEVVGTDWQVRGALTGQWSKNVLILGEQMRLGGMNGVRGFSEGSEAGESATRWTLEGYTPQDEYRGIKGRALAFFDGGKVRSSSGSSAAITSAGLGLRTMVYDYALRMDVARIGKAGTDPMQKAGNWRGHFELSANF